MKPTLIFDCEIYRDYFAVGFLNADTGNVRILEMYDGQPLDVATLRAILSKYRIVGFNSNGFDLPILEEALAGGSCVELKKITDRIIKNNQRIWHSLEIDHIDLIEVAPGVASLKLYAGRMHAPRMQDLPIEPDESISPEQRPVLREYLVNDLNATLALFRKLEPQIQLREQMSAEYGIDLRSRSDAQIAEQVIKSQVEKRMGKRIEKQDPFRLAGETFKYKFPDFLCTSPAIRKEIRETLTNATFTIGSNGVVQMPKEIANLEIKIGQSVYRMGIGGLHSSEKSVAHFADDDHILVDRDVASYYPAIILNCGLRPAHMGEHFTQVYRDIVERRLVAKRRGDKVTADSLKITINGSFGKFGSPYSALYSPTLLIQTTVTGQLSLLMLIEMLESEGIPVVSANTDGIVIKCPRSKVEVMGYIVWEWEHLTGFETEATQYRALYSASVNSYIAIKTDGHYKAKGPFAPAGLQKNPTNEIVTEAVVAFLRHGTPVEQTIRQCNDVTKFVTVRTVKGGALDQAGNYLGKAIRWYYARGVTGPLTYKINGYTVPRSEGAKPLMDLPPAFPTDIDFDWYIREVESILNDIGART